jgi:hypothetical protein
MAVCARHSALFLLITIFSLVLSLSVATAKELRGGTATSPVPSSERASAQASEGRTATSAIQGGEANHLPQRIESTPVIAPARTRVEKGLVPPTASSSANAEDRPVPTVRPEAPVSSKGDQVPEGARAQAGDVVMKATTPPAKPVSPRSKGK